jgi:hypothetical protein
MTHVWKRAERPTPPLHELWRIKQFPPTPCVEAADGTWFHPMPQGVPVALAHLGRDPMEINPMAAAFGEYEERKAYFDTVREIYLERPSNEWIELLQAADVPCQPVGSAESALDHPQLNHNGAVTVVDLPGVGPVRQFGRSAPTATSRLHRHHRPRSANTSPSPPAAHMDAPDPSNALGPRRVRSPASSSTWHRFAGPFGLTILSDLGAGDQDRRHRSVSVNRASPVGASAASAASHRLEVRSRAAYRGRADRSPTCPLQPPHRGRRTSRLRYEQARDQLIVFATPHAAVARWPRAGCRTRWAAVVRTRVRAGRHLSGHPTWYRFFYVRRAATGMLPVVGVLEALLTLTTPDVAASGKTGPTSSPPGCSFGRTRLSDPTSSTRPHLDRFRWAWAAPLVRWYPTLAGIAADGRDARRCDATGQDATGAGQEPVFRTRSAVEWFATPDAAPVCRRLSTDGRCALVR